MRAEETQYGPQEPDRCSQEVSISAQTPPRCPINETLHRLHCCANALLALIIITTFYHITLHLVVIYYYKINTKRPVSCRKQTVPINTLLTSKCKLIRCGFNIFVFYERVIKKKKI